MTGSAFPSSRPRCGEHGLLLDDAGGCSRCSRAPEAKQAFGLLGRVVALALVGIALLLVVRVAGITYELVRASHAGATAAGPVAPAQNGTRLVVYTMTGCRACRMAKTWMDQNAVVYDERNIDDAAARKELASLGKGMAVPTFVVDDQVLVGFDARGVRLTEALQAHGIK